jgi:hypothetical protein
VSCPDCPLTCIAELLAQWCPDGTSFAARRIPASITEGTNCRQLVDAYLATRAHLAAGSWRDNVGFLTADLLVKVMSLLDPYVYRAERPRTHAPVALVSARVPGLCISPRDLCDEGQGDVGDVLAALDRWRGPSWGEYVTFAYWMMWQCETARRRWRRTWGEAISLDSPAAAGLAAPPPRYQLVPLAGLVCEFAATGELPPEQGLVLLLTAQDLSGAQIAERLGLSKANVRVLRHRGLERLRDLLHDSQA